MDRNVLGRRVKPHNEAASLSSIVGATYTGRENKRGYHSQAAGSGCRIQSSRTACFRYTSLNSQELKKPLSDTVGR